MTGRMTGRITGRRLWRAGVVGAALVLGLAGCGPADVEEPTPAVSEALGSPEEYAAALFDGTNLARTAEGQPALAPSVCAQEQGALRAQALDDAGEELVHAPLAPVIAACPPASTAGENLSRASLGPDAVVDAWMQSPGHRENILTPEFTELGIACVVSGGAGDEQMLCAQIFLG